MKEIISHFYDRTTAKTLSFRTPNFMKNILFNVPVFALTLLLISCKNYYLPKESFVQQFSGIDSTQLRKVSVVGPMGMFMEYQANPLNTIRCVDKAGNPATLFNGPSIETRMTINDKKRVVFYFDRVLLIDSVVYGVQSRFINVRTSIPLKDITKIEVQDGHKKFTYLKVHD